MCRRETLACSGITANEAVKRRGTHGASCERAVRAGIDDGSLSGNETLPVRATLSIEGVAIDFHVDGELTLS